METNFANIRNQKKITQQDVAKKLKITQATLSSYETGRTNPDMETLCKLADCFNVSVDCLLNHSSNDLILPLLSNEQKKAIKILIALPEVYFNKIYGNLETYQEMLRLQI